MTFIDFYNEVSAAVFPEGEAENLILPHKLSVKDALIDLQSKVLCLRAANTDFICKADAIFHCGANVVPAVEGNIERVFSVSVDAPCEEIEYAFISADTMRATVAGYRCCTAANSYDGYPAAACGPSATPPPFASSTMYDDKGYRAGDGRAFWSLVRGDVWVYPYIESTEQIAIDWNGIRRTWNDDTRMPAVLLERDVQSAVEYYLQAEVDRRETKNVTSYQLHAGLYRDAVGQMIFECRKKHTFIRPPKATAQASCR